MKRFVLAVVACSLVLPMAPAAAGSRPTLTELHVADDTMENFGAYRLFGAVRPSQEDDRVRFSYKRAGGERWRRFKAAGDEGADGRGFYVLGQRRPRAKIDRTRRFAVDITPSVAPGRWVLRAVYPAQNGRARSADKVRVTVSGSD